MQRLEVSGAVRPIYGSLGVKRLMLQLRCDLYSFRQATELMTRQHSQHFVGFNFLVATDYGLDGPESKPGEDEIFRPSRLALDPTQPPVQWVPGLSRG